MQYKVLIVDDSKLARMVMASALRRIRPEWELIEATNAEEPLARFRPVRRYRAGRFQMPGIDGLELVAKIRKAQPDDAGGGGLGQPAGRDYCPGEGT